MKLALNIGKSRAVGPTPVVLISGWMGATPRHLRRIQETYNERGMDTLTFSAGPNEVLFPKKAIDLMEVLYLYICINICSKKRIFIIRHFIAQHGLSVDRVKGLRSANYISWFLDEWLFVSFVVHH